MSIEKNIERLHELDEKLSSLNYAQVLISWDGQTLAPKRSVDGRATALKGLSAYYYNTLISEETKAVLSELDGEKENLSEIDAAKLKILKIEYDKLAAVPAKEYTEYNSLITKSLYAWEDAKANNNFDAFAPYLEKVISYNKKYIEYRDKGGHPYNTLLDDYEKDLTVDIVDYFFKDLQKEILPLVKEIEKKPQVVLDFKGQKFDAHKQEEFSKFMMEQLGFRMDSGVLAESVHPFTMNISREDVRITTHYYEDDLKSALLSTIHETGHAIYEQNVDAAYGLSIIAAGTSMGIHESQSRLFENNFGRSYPFWQHYYEKLKKIFPKQLNAIQLDTFYKGINYVEPSLIRTEADEVTYPLHIMVRYEIEKMIFENKVKVKELPELWREKYKEYLGITPENDSDGILQDVHWSEGLFGYFPSYALGSAYSAQFENTMMKSINVFEKLQNGDFKDIVHWLNENIHRFGRIKTPNQILLDATGEQFNPNYYIIYLKEKFTGMYR